MMKKERVVSLTFQHRHKMKKEKRLHYIKADRKLLESHNAL